MCLCEVTVGGRRAAACKSFDSEQQNTREKTSIGMISSGSVGLCSLSGADNILTMLLTMCGHWPQQCTEVLR